MKGGLEMIEVAYNDNLEENIQKANKTLDKKSVFKKTAPIAITVLAGAYALFGFDVINPTFINMVYTVGGVGALYAVNGAVTNAVRKNRINKERKIAERSLNSLANALEDDARVGVEVKDLKEAISEEFEMDSNSHKNKKAGVIKRTDLKKIVTHFYLLDEKDQIKVLEQIATSRIYNTANTDDTNTSRINTSANTVDDGTTYETFLLEEGDLNYEDPSNVFRRKLVRK